MEGAEGHEDEDALKLTVNSEKNRLENRRDAIYCINQEEIITGALLNLSNLPSRWHK